MCHTAPPGDGSAVQACEKEAHRPIRVSGGRWRLLVPLCEKRGSQRSPRPGHTILVGRSITAEDVAQELARQFALHGSPAHLRSVNGPELVARTVRGYLKSQAADMHYIEPGAPRQNAYVEGTCSNLYDELLDRELFTTALEAEGLSEVLRLPQRRVPP